MIVRALLVTLLAGVACAQTKPTTLPITLERADELLAELSADPWEKTKDASVLAWNEAYTLAALLDLHAFSGDVKYLDEFVRRADQALSHRDDRRGFKDASGQTHKRWSVDSKYTIATATLVDATRKP